MPIAFDICDGALQDADLHAQLAERSRVPAQAASIRALGVGGELTILGLDKRGDLLQEYDQRGRQRLASPRGDRRDALAATTAWSSRVSAAL